MGIRAMDIQVRYGEKEVLKSIDFSVEDGQIVSIIGPNGSGKSTLIKALSRCIKPCKGTIYLDDEDIFQISTKKVARKMAVLPQVKAISPDITIRELVSYGRYPYLKFGQRLNKQDNEIIEWAIERTRLTNLRNRHIISLSGGERQRGWIALALAQKPNILLLDEPTTFLDISYQLEVLELIKELNKTLKLTVIMVLHDLNQAARYSDKIFVLNEGSIWEWGNPNGVLNERLLEDVFSIEGHIYEDKINLCPYFIPYRII